MKTSRRNAIAAIAASPCFGRSAGIWLAVPDWMIGRIANPEALALARQCGLHGVEISLGAWKKRPLARLALDDGELQHAYLARSKAEGIRIAATCLDVALAQYPLKNDPDARKWLLAGISVTSRLGVRVMIVPCAGPGAMTSPADIERVSAVLRDCAPQAEAAGVTIGLEDLLSAEDNARLLDRVGSPAVRVFYDTGNSRKAGFEVVGEIRRLGAGRICQFHFKDGESFLGGGAIDFRAVGQAIAAIGFTGWIGLETPAPTRSMETDLRRNAAFVRGVVSGVEP